MRSYGSCAFSFTRNCESISQSGCVMSHPHQDAEGSQARGYTNLTLVVEHAPPFSIHTCVGPPLALGSRFLRESLCLTAIPAGGRKEHALKF